MGSSALLNATAIVLVRADAPDPRSLPTPGGRSPNGMIIAAPSISGRLKMDSGVVGPGDCQRLNFFNLLVIGHQSSERAVRANRARSTRGPARSRRPTDGTRRAGSHLDLHQ